MMEHEKVIQGVQNLQQLARELNQHLADFTQEETDALAAVLPDLAPFFQKFRSPEINTGQLVDQSHQTYIETELRRLLAENRRQEALLDAIFAADPGGLAVVIGQDLRFVYANPAYRYICPSLGEDLIDQPYQLVWSAEQDLGFYQQIHSVLDTGRPFQIQGYERDFPDGSKRVFTFQARRIGWDHESAALLIFWDTTDLTLSQRQLQTLLDQTHHQAEELRGLFNAMSDAVIIYDVQGEVLHANPALLQILGFDPTGKKREEITAQMINRWPDGRRMEVDELPSARAIQGEPVQGQRVWLTNAAGRSYLVEMTANLLYSQRDAAAEPQVHGVVVVWHDITERYAAEQQTSLQQTWFRTALASIGDAVITTDTAGQVTFLNPVAEQLTGWAFAEAAGKPLGQVFNIINEKTGLPALNPVSRVLEQGIIVGLANHTALIARDGRQIPIEDSAAPIKDADGQLSGVVMVFHDVTEARRAETALRESEDKYRTVADFTYDWETWIGPDGAYRYVSPSCERITGYPSREFLSDPGLLEQITHPDDRAKIARHLQDELSGSQPLEPLDFRVITPGGEVRWIDHACQPVFDHNGLWSGRRSSNRDISDRIRYEAERERLLAENQRQRELLEAQSFVDPGGQTIVSGEDLIIRSANPAYRALTPHPEKDPIGQPYEQIWPPEEGFTQHELIRQAIREGKDIHQQRHARRMPDGRTCYYTFHIHPIDWEGQPAAYLVLWNVMELVERESELRESEAELQKTNEALRQQNRLIQLSYEPIFTWELEGDITSWNEGCAQLYGYSQAEAVGRSGHALLQTRHPVPLAEVKAQLRAGGVWTGELRHRTKSGREIIVESRQQLMEVDGQQIVLETNRDITERKQFEARLAAEREWFHITLSSIGDAVITTDAEGKVSFLNPVAEQLTGWASSDAAGQPMEVVFHIINEQTRQPAANPVARVLSEGVVVGLANHTALIDRQGRETPIEDSAAPIQDASGQTLGVVMVFRDVTKKRKTEQAVQQLNRTLQALNKSNQVMMRASDESTFMNEVCRIITEDCGYAMVWLGLAEQDAEKTVRPVAHAGYDAGYLDTLKVTWADTDRGRGPTGTAIRTGRPSLCRNMLTDPQFAPWREEASKRGYASSLVLPLMEAGQAFGALTVYDREPDAFEEDEIRLLSELSNDLSYGITAMRVRAAHARAEQALRESEMRYRSLFQGMTEGFALHEIVCDDAGNAKDYRFLDLNPAFERLTGLSLADIQGKLKSEIPQLEGDDPQWVDIYGKVALTGESVHFENYSPALDRHYEVFAYRPAPLQFAVIFMDITERKQAEVALRQAREVAEQNRTQIEVQHHLIEQREQERQQIARDLHDGPVQSITGVTFALQSLITDIADRQQKKELEQMPASVQESVSSLKEVVISLQEVLGELRGYAIDLRPPILFSFGLRRAIQAHLEGFQEKHPEIHTQLKVDWDGDPIPEQVSIALYRIYQESLNNIVKHAQASQIWVQLGRDAHQVRLAIEDNGVGFSMPKVPLQLVRQGHLGLVGMRERVEATGGSLEIDSQPGKGTRIEVQAPLG